MFGKKEQGLSERERSVVAKAIGLAEELAAAGVNVGAGDPKVQLDTLVAILKDFYKADDNLERLSELAGQYSVEVVRVVLEGGQDISPATKKQIDAVIEKCRAAQKKLDDLLKSTDFEKVFGPAFDAQFKFTSDAIDALSVKQVSVDALVYDTRGKARIGKVAKPDAEALIKFSQSKEVPEGVKGVDIDAWKAMVKVANEKVVEYTRAFTDPVNIDAVRGKTLEEYIAERFNADDGFKGQLKAFQAAAKKSAKEAIDKQKGLLLGGLKEARTTLDTANKKLLTDIEKAEHTVSVQTLTKLREQLGVVKGGIENYRRTRNMTIAIAITGVGLAYLLWEKMRARPMEAAKQQKIAVIEGLVHEIQEELRKPGPEDRTYDAAARKAAVADIEKRAKKFGASIKPREPLGFLHDQVRAPEAVPREVPKRH